MILTTRSNQLSMKKWESTLKKKELRNWHLSSQLTGSNTGTISTTKSSLSMKTRRTSLKAWINLKNLTSTNKKKSVTNTVRRCLRMLLATKNCSLRKKKSSGGSSSHSHNSKKNSKVILMKCRKPIMTMLKRNFQPFSSLKRELRSQQIKQKKRWTRSRMTLWEKS